MKLLKTVKPTAKRIRDMVEAAENDERVSFMYSSVKGNTAYRRTVTLKAPVSYSTSFDPATMIYGVDERDARSSVKTWRFDRMWAIRWLE